MRKSEESHITDSKKCPICNIELAYFWGEKMHPNNKSYGITIYCPSKECPAQEVSSHGENYKDAYETLLHKYKNPGNSEAGKF